MTDWMNIRWEQGHTQIEGGTLDEKLIDYMNEEPTNFIDILEEDEVVGPILASLAETGRGVLVVKCNDVAMESEPMNRQWNGYDPGGAWMICNGDLEILLHCEE